MNTPPASPLKILVVEDDFTNRSVLLELLRHHGTVHVAINGAEAVEACRNSLEAGQPYGLVCMDIVMPGMDGLEALRAIRALEAARGVVSSHGARVLMITGRTDLKGVFESYHGLCDGYLVKPIDRTRLLAEMQKAGLLA